MGQESAATLASLGPGDEFVVSGSATGIDACSECGSPLGLEAPSSESPASTWLCGGCGSAYFGALAPRELRPPRCSVRPTEIHQVISTAIMHPFSRGAAMPHRDLHCVLKFLARHDYSGPERRNNQRYAMAMPVLGVPLNGSFRVAGPAAEMTTINISRSGCALLDSQPCRAPYLVLDLSVTGLGPFLVILEALRMRPLMSAFEIAGRWHSRVLTGRHSLPVETIPFR
jgi:hypothetical protein